MSKYFLMQDQQKCIGCHSCEIQCKINKSLPPETALSSFRWDLGFSTVNPGLPLFSCLVFIVKMHGVFLHAPPVLCSAVKKTASFSWITIYMGM